MYIISINDTRYNLPSQWSEVSISRARKMKRVGANARNLDALTTAEAATILSVTCDIAPRLLSNVEHSDTLLCAAWIVGRFIHQLNSNTFEQVAKVKSFTWHGKDFTTPLTSRDINRHIIPFATTTSRALCEASDLATLDAIEYGAQIVATLCTNTAPIETMKLCRQLENLPMDILLALLRELYDTHRHLAKYYPLTYCRHANTSWYDLIYTTANFSPSQTAYTESMNCYDLFALSEAKIRLQADFKI